MFAYYLALALRSLRRNPVLTGLMVLSIAVGIGAAMTTLTVLHLLSGDPLPRRSGQIFYPQVDAFRHDKPFKNPPDMLDYTSAMDLWQARRADRQAIVVSSQIKLQSPDQGEPAVMTQLLSTHADFFPMFEVPFAHGRPWTGEDDAARARVAVLSSALAQKLFGNADPTGRTLQLGKAAFRVIGVIGDWNPNPRFYDLTNTRYSGDAEEVYVTFSTSRDLRWGNSGNMSCWGSDDEDPEGSTGPNQPCVWLQYWAQLDTPQEAADYRAYLVNYSDRQHAAGRFERPTNVRLSDVMTWLDFNQVVPSDVRLQAWLALGFLGVCLLNTVGLLLAKFLRRGGEVGVRRALGATRGDIFLQCLIEAGTVGLAGGVLGLGLAVLGLWAVRHQPTDYADLARLDLPMLLATFVLAIVSSLIAGILPAWRAMQVTPAIQLKTQ